MVQEIMKTVKFVGAKRTIETDDELDELLNTLISDFHRLRFEEWLLILHGIRNGRFGKWYERLKSVEFYDAFRQHEQGNERAHLEYARNENLGREKLSEDVDMNALYQAAADRLKRERDEFFKKQEQLHVERQLKNDAAAKLAIEEREQMNQEWPEGWSDELESQFEVLSRKALNGAISLPQAEKLDELERMKIQAFENQKQES